MKVSFIVIAYNEERNIEQTIHAIEAQLSMPTHEIVIVNDGSKDRTLDIVQGLARTNKAIKVVDQQPNKGRGAARAAGVAVAKGDYFAFVDADILLPDNWLKSCLSYMDRCDACGGTAVPDGDVAYIHRILRLTPKVAPHTTTVSGANGLFRREVFNKVSFDPHKKNGEDVDLGYQILSAGFKALSVPNLLVEHNETKSYAESLKWLFVSGRGASRQFYEHKELRLPDIAFFGFVVVSLLAAFASMWARNVSIVPIASGVAIIAYVSVSSLMHLRSKFELMKTPVKSLFGLAINDTLLLAYYLGRLLGMMVEWRSR